MNKIFKYTTVSLMLASLFSACTEDEGTNPGGDSTPVATTYEYTASTSDGLNPDNDCVFRVATNAAAKQTYYLAELVTEKTARNMSDDEYAAYVVEKGTKIEVAASSSADVLLKDLHGLYTVTVVATNGNKRTSQSFDFAGLDYKPFGNCTFMSEFFGTEKKVAVEYSEVGDRYRIADAWGHGAGFAFSANGNKVTVYPSSFLTGYVHPRYGDLTATDQGSTYDQKTKTFSFVFRFTVAAGSFGTNTETLVLDN